MSTRFLDVIDWTRPWLAPFRSTAEPIIQAADWRLALNSAAAAASLRNHRGLPIRFVPQAELPAGTAYEAFISATGNVPTRENLHDFFNALVWLTFPRIKAQLNALQAAEIAKSAVSAARGKLRDAATLFDENAAIFIAHDRGLIDALREHRWNEMFISRRAEFERHCEVWLFGHALMEKLASPYKAITAHTWTIMGNDEFPAMPALDQRKWIDETVARQLANGLVASDFTPLPVLGVPGWSPSQNEDFYADVMVFRPKKNPSR
jgi:hypothetical protein